jgi:hypothetical protein
MPGREELKIIFKALYARVLNLALIVVILVADIPK